MLEIMTKKIGGFKTVYKNYQARYTNSVTREMYRFLAKQVIMMLLG